MRVWEYDMLRGHLVLIDEGSMINEETASDLLMAGCKMVVFMDHGQLPPVKGSMHFTQPDVTLQDVQRQALDSAVLRQAVQCSQQWAIRGRRRILPNLPLARLARR